MITAHMMGNIGNQMFIYAMARALQLKYNEKLTIDLGGLKRGYYTANNKLDCFDLPKDISYDLGQLSTTSRLWYKASSFIFHVEHKLVRMYKKDLIIPDFICKIWFHLGCYYNTNRPFMQYGECKRKNKYLYGYFQSDKYFNEYREEIVKDFTVISPLSESSKMLMADMTTYNSVAVSIRANMAPENPNVKDNLELGFIDKDFYYRGMDEIAKRIENPVFYIFSDDLEIVKRDYQFHYPVVYVSPSDSSDGIRLMYSCKHYVIANSTFSWWGAYLSRNMNKIVIMPSVWDRKGPARKDIYFGNPIKLDVTFLTE